MKNNELFIGLDIGTTKIVAMIGYVNEYSKLKIIGIGKSESYSWMFDLSKGDMGMVPHTGNNRN